MPIYMASFAGLLSAVVLAVVYLADRYEPEPVELIQSCFLFGSVSQLALLIAVQQGAGLMLWQGPWLLLTVAGAAIALPWHRRVMTEMDERFDGIVYTVAFLVGCTCVIHVNNLPQIAAASPFREALDEAAAPGLRDLLIIDSSPGFAAELGRGLVVVLAGVLVGAALGLLHRRRQSPVKMAGPCAIVGIAVLGGDLVFDGALLYRGLLAAGATSVAVVLKRRSVYREHRQPAEADVLVMGFKTLLMVLGAALLAMALLQAVFPRGEEALDAHQGGIVGRSGLTRARTPTPQLWSELALWRGRPRPRPEIFKFRSLVS